MSATCSAGGYEAFPLLLTPERAPVASALIRAICRHESYFTDYDTLCDAACLRHDCAVCSRRLSQVARVLVRSDSMYWEVWSDEEPKRLCGLLYLSDIVPGCEATTHYVFFDGHLRDKTPLLLAMLDWVFSDHPELSWRGLHRLTVEVPTTHTALAAHAQKRLGFVAEGTKREVIRQRGKWLDTLILGRLSNG